VSPLPGGRWGEGPFEAAEAVGGQERQASFPPAGGRRNAREDLLSSGAAR